MQRYRFLAQAAVAAVTAWAMVGAVAAQTIKIGVIQPLTGAFAASGTDVTNGAKIAVDEINSKGGLLGKKLELIIEDSKSNPTEASSVAEKLMVRDKVPVLMGASGSNATLAVMPKLMEYKVPMLVETSSAGKITTLGNPYIFRIAPPSDIEAAAFAKIVDKIGMKKADFLVVNNDWGLGTAADFSKMLKSKGINTGLVEAMDASAQDISAQLVKLKGTDADTLIVTGAVEQLTLVFKQATALGLKRRIITTGGSQNPDQIVQQAGTAAEGTMHLVFFAPWAPDATPSPSAAKAFIEEWKKEGHSFGALSQSFRGYDGIRTIAAAIQLAGIAESEAIRAALWKVKVDGLNGKIAFDKVGPEGRESAQSVPQVYLVQVDGSKVVLPKL